MTNENKQPEIIRLSNGLEAQLLVPNLQEGDSLSVVNTEVLKRIVSHLPKVSINEIKYEMKENIDSCLDIHEYLNALKEELSFHSSVNVIANFFYKDK